MFVNEKFTEYTVRVDSTNVWQFHQVNSARSYTEKTILLKYLKNSA